MENAAPPSSVVDQWLNQGAEQIRAGRWAEAESTYRRILTVQIGSAEVHHSLGMALHRQGRLQEAAAAVRAALALRPDFVQAWINLGSMLREMNQPAEAIEAHRKALELQPDQPIPWNNMGNALQAAHGTGLLRRSRAYGKVP